MAEKLGVAATLCCLLLAAPARADSTLETTGTGVAIALPLVAGTIALSKNDTHGFGQLVLETGLTVGTAYALKQFVRERRPDGSDYQSFPSDTTALAASGSAFLWRRYGWQYGLPAFAASQFVSFTRVDAKKHHWYDTLASSAIAAGYAYVISEPFERKRVRTSLSASPEGAFVQLSFNF